MNAPATARRLTPNQQARRHRILEAARELVAQNGYDGMIMRDVANAARVSPTTLYNLYNTKDELLLEALRDAVAEDFNRAAQQAPELGFDRLMSQAHQSATHTRASTAYAAAITQALLRAGKGDQIVEVLIHRSARAVIASLSAMRARGELHERTDVDELAIAMVGSFWGNYMLWGKGAIALDRLEHHIKRSYLVYLLPAAQGRTRKDIERQLGEL